MITIIAELEINIPKSEVPAGLLADEDVFHEAFIDALCQAFTNLGATDDDVTITYVDFEGLHDDKD